MRDPLEARQNSCADLSMKEAQKAALRWRTTPSNDVPYKGDMLRELGAVECGTSGSMM